MKPMRPATIPARYPLLPLLTAAFIVALLKACSALPM
jgi:hypothetical protein